MLNQFNCIARVGKKEVKTSMDSNYIQLSLATDIYDGKDNKAVWFYVSVFKQQAKYVNDYIDVGDTVSVNGQLDQYTYQNKEKKNVTQLQIRANQINLVSKKQATTEYKKEEGKELAF